MLQKWPVFNDMFNLFGIPDRPMDITENEKAWSIEVDIPGVDPAAVEVEAANGELSIKADRKWSKSQGNGTFRRSFSERFILPEKADSEAISATYANGVLIVTVPKRAGPMGRKVEVKVV